MAQGHEHYPQGTWVLHTQDDLLYGEGHTCDWDDTKYKMGLVIKLDNPHPVKTITWTLTDVRKVATPSANQHVRGSVDMKIMERDHRLLARLKAGDPTILEVGYEDRVLFTCRRQFGMETMPWELPLADLDSRGNPC